MYDTHKNNNNKMMAAILVCIVICFMIGYGIGTATLTPPLKDREPTAQELIDRIHDSK